jgi:hypothetical protein
MATTVALEQAKAMHDALLAEKPDDATHDRAECALCVMTDAEIPADAGDTGGKMSYSEEELKAAVDAAVRTATAELEAKVKEAAAEASETEQQLEELRTAHEAEKSELQAKLDEAVLQAQTEKDRADGIVTWLEEEGAKAEAEAAIAARRDDRLAAVRESANFPDEYLESNADRWAAMSDEDFEARLGEYKVISGKGGDGGGGGDTLPTHTALHASREGREPTTTAKPSAVKELFKLRRDGVDVRTL